MKILIINPQNLPRFFPLQQGRWNIHEDFPDLKWDFSQADFQIPMDALISADRGKTSNSIYLKGLKIKLFPSSGGEPYSLFSEIYKAKIPASWYGEINYHFPHARKDNFWMNLRFERQFRD